MKARLEDRNKAIELRKQGLSYKEIQAVVPVSKGLLSGWLSYLDMSPVEEERLRSKLKERKNRGRMNSLISNRTRRIEREKVVIKEAKSFFAIHNNDPMFLMGVILYWAEGGKHVSNFQFINSDPDMIFLMYKWIQKFLSVPRDAIKVRIFIHNIPGYEDARGFWSKNLGIEPRLFQQTIYKPTKRAVKKDPYYKGCVRLSVTKIRYLRLMKAWQKLFMQYYGEAFMHS